MTMLLAHEQDPDAVLWRLGPLVPILYRAVEAGIAESLDFFSSREQPVDPCLQPNLVRWKAKQILDEAGHLTELESDNVVPLAGRTFARLPIANNGLQLSYADLLLRILKSDGGGVPLAGASRARQRFYHQLSLLGEEAVDVLKLLVLWDVDQLGLDGELLLVCPKRGAETKDSLEVHWMVAIPHPAEGFGATSDPAPDRGDQDDGLYRLPGRDVERDEQ
jgi:hypothetical protein